MPPIDQRADQFRAACAQALSALEPFPLVTVWRVGVEDFPFTSSTASAETETTRQRFLTGRRLLRRIVVAAYCRCPVEDVHISTRCAACGSTGHGRPTVIAPDRGAGLYVSTAMSEGTAVVCVGTVPIGVDVEERSRPELAVLSEMPAALRGVWSSVERVMGPGLRRPAIDVWTALEAISKGLGVGIAATPQDIESARDEWSLAWPAIGDDIVVCVAARAPRPAIAAIDLRTFRMELPRVDLEVLRSAPLA